MLRQKSIPKYQQIVDSLRAEIARGVYGHGERLPSDNNLGKRFGVSRLTVIHALKQLAFEGTVRRKAGAGTFVGSKTGSPTTARTFGLLIPDLGEGEIFEPICQGMARAEQPEHQALLWGNTTSAASSKSERAEELCRYFIQRKVDGVFFAPIELSSGKDKTNLSIASQLERAAIPVVLLDRCYLEFPDRGNFDLIGIDNRRAGYQMTEHLLNAGCRTLGFVVRPGSAPTVEARIAGFMEAQWRRGIEVPIHRILRADPSDMKTLRQWLDKIRPDGLVCANDHTAAVVMQALLQFGISVPGNVRIVGFDDVKYASLLPVPLTTLRQPCQEIGAAAISAMLERVARPGMPARDILLPCQLVIRQSCGTA